MFQVPGEGVTHALVCLYPARSSGPGVDAGQLELAVDSEPVAESAEFLLAHLSPLFVPVGVEC